MIWWYLIGSKLCCNLACSECPCPSSAWFLARFGRFYQAGAREAEKKYALIVVNHVAMTDGGLELMIDGWKKICALISFYRSIMVFMFSLFAIFFEGSLYLKLILSAEVWRDRQGHSLVHCRSRHFLAYGQTRACWSYISAIMYVEVSLRTSC